MLHTSWLQSLPTCYQVQLLSCPLFSIPVSKDWNRPADPPGDHLVSRPITKFNGQPSLPVLLVTEYHRLQRIVVAKIAGYRADGLLTGFIQMDQCPGRQLMFFLSTKCLKCGTKVYLKGPDYITFWNLGNLGSWTLGSTILKEGYTLPYQFRPGLQGARTS